MRIVKLAKSRTVQILAVAVVMSGVGLLCGAKPAHALSNLGPDPADFTGGSSEFGFIVTSADNSDVNIPQTRVNLYFKNNTGTKTVTIEDANLCTDTRGTAPSSGGNYRDYAGTGVVSGSQTTQYYAAAGTYTSSSVYGVFSSSNTCYASTRSISIPGSSLIYDANTGYYSVTFVAQIMSAVHGGQNIFDLKLSDSDAIVGYRAGQSETSFGLARETPSSGYRNYYLRFGPSCNINSPQTATGHFYDDDNGDSAVQPEAMWNQMLKYKEDGTFVGYEPMAFTGAQKVTVKDATTHSYEVYSGSKKSVTMTFTVEPGYKYVWRWSHVYFVNILQFRLPFDSIYYTSGCQQPPITPPNCAGVTFDPARPDPETAFSVTAAVDYQNAQDATSAQGSGDKMFIKVDGPGESFNNSDVPTTLSGTRLSGSASVPASHNTGSYTVTYGMTGRGPVTCTATFVIADQPVVTTTGGDTGAGAGMSVGGVDCAVPSEPKGGLVSWNKGAAGNYGGAGTKYAALALNHLQDFATAQGTSGLAPSGLAFANTSDGDVDETNGLFGGLFGGLSCVRDYFADATNIQTGNVTINGQTIANGSSKVTYVKGNVYITGNISFSGSYANTAQIPSFSVIVEGNIYIAPGVTQLDGLYVAQPKLQGGVPADGVIYTCASAPFVAAPLDSTLWANCHSNSLQINGSLVARQVWLERAAGTLGSGVAAESVNFTPEVWLTTPPETSSGSTSAPEGYDAITSLPPIL